MMALRTRKIAPELPGGVDEGFAGSRERECGEGCSRESISDDQAQLVGNEDQSLSHPKPAAMHWHQLADPAAQTSVEVKPESRRFVRYRNSWVRENDITLNLGLFRRTPNASQIEEEEDEGGSDDGANASKVNAADYHEATDPAKALLAYFIWLSNSTTEDVDFQLIEKLLTDGADVNAATESGATVIHDVASNWDVTVAEFLFERGANIHVINSLGQSPLHLASSTDHIEMVKWLLEKGAHLDGKTVIEMQTPLHYAARNDSLETLQILIERGGNYEVPDYKGRTPLHLAAELDRTVAAEFLLSLDPPAECRVVDNRGNHIITSMIRTMPQVAEVALNQLHRIASAERKQFFLLNHLEPENAQMSRHGIKTPFEMAVERGQYSILTHPVMEELIRHKWKYCVRWSFYALFGVYVLFVLSWSLLIAYPSVQEKHIYIFPRDLWRIVLAVIAVGTLIYQVGDELREVLKSRRKHKAYTKLRTRDLEDDLKNVDPSLSEEKKYLENELISTNRTPSNYFKDPWNIIDIVCYSNIFILILLHSIDVAFHFESLALWTARLACPAIILIWVRLLKYARAFHAIGPLIAIIGHLIGDILRYFTLYGIFLIPYVISFWIIFGGDRAAGEPDNSDLIKVYRTAVMVFRLSLTDDYPYNTLRDIDELMAVILVVTFLLIAAVIGLNLFIALLSDTFQRVYDNAQANALLQQAQLILSYEEKVCSCIYERYLKHIQNNCNPSSLYYDDDDKGGAPPEVQKITHQIHSIVSELQMDKVEENRTRSSEIENLAEKLAQQDEKMATMSQTLSEIKALLDALQYSVTATDKIRAAPSLLEDRQLTKTSDGAATDIFNRLHPYQKTSTTTIPQAVGVPQARTIHVLPPIMYPTDIKRDRWRRGGKHMYNSEAEILRNSSASQSSLESCSLQPCRSSPGYIDCTSGSCSSLRLSGSASHRRVRKLKKIQTKDSLKWKHKR